MEGEITGTASQREVNQIREKVWHTDGEVTALKTQVGSIVETLRRIEQGIMNRPPLWNMGTVLTLVGVLGGTFFGLSQYVDLRIAAIDANVLKKEVSENYNKEKLDTWKADKDAFQRETHYEFGVQTSENKYYSKSIETITKNIDRLTDRVNEIVVIEATNHAPH